MDPLLPLVVAAMAAALVLVAAMCAALAFKIITIATKTDKKEKKDNKDKKHNNKKDKSESRSKKSTDADWEWPIFDEWYSRETWSYERKQRGAQDDNDKDNKPFEVTYRRQKDWPDDMSVTLFSPHLVEIIGKCLPKSKAMTDMKPKLSGQLLFLAMDTIRNYESSEKEEKKEGEEDAVRTTAAIATDAKLQQQSMKSATKAATAADAKKLQKESSGKSNEKTSSTRTTTADAKKKLQQESSPEETSVAAIAKLHVGHLLRFLEKEYKDTQAQYDRMKQEGSTSWAMLWAFLPRGEKCYYYCQLSGQQVCGKVRSRHYYKHHETGTKRLFVELDVMDYNGQSFRACNVQREILEFQNEKGFDSLAVCPLRFSAKPQLQREQMEAAFVANGRRFYELSVLKPNRFMRFRGPLVRWEFIPGTSCSHVVKNKADGRVMIDLWSFARMNPGYDMGNATPPTACDLMCGSSSSSHGDDAQADDVSGRSSDLPDDESLMLAPAIVYGFSFSIKQWGGFPVTGFSEIFFDDQAFDRHLVMRDQVQKRMLLALVSQYLQDPETTAVANGRGDDGNGGAQQQQLVVPSIDPISEKGEGCIFLCYGPPGTGKTLTAESVAEKLHRPLWAVSASELSFEVDKLEQKLVQILDIASSWRAVLLLDEADIYLEKRTSAGDPKRNAMTGVFLRLLEYYKGVLFLTTNRVTTFDDAFCSRISMFLRYHRLTRSHRTQVWETLLSRVGLLHHDNNPDVDLDLFAVYELNGREIRNTIRTAHTWATSCKQPLTSQHVLSVVEMLQEFRKDLQEAQLEESEVDSPFSSVLAKLQQQQQPPPPPPAILSSSNNNTSSSNGDVSFKP